MHGDITELDSQADTELGTIMADCSDVIAQAILDSIYRDLNFEIAERIPKSNLWRQQLNGVPGEPVWWAVFEFNWSGLNSKYIVRRIYSQQTLVTDASK